MFLVKRPNAIITIYGIYPILQVYDKGRKFQMTFSMADKALKRFVFIPLGIIRIFARFV